MNIIYTCFLDTRGTYVLDLWRRHTHTISPQKLTQICSHLTGRVATGLQLTSTFDGKPGIMPRSITYPGKRTPSLTCCFWDPHAGFTFFFGKIILIFLVKFPPDMNEISKTGLPKNHLFSRTVMERHQPRWTSWSGSYIHMDQHITQRHRCIRLLLTP